MNASAFKQLEAGQMTAITGGYRIKNYHDTDGDGMLDSKEVWVYRRGKLVKHKTVYDRKY